MGVLLKPYRGPTGHVPVPTLQKAGLTRRRPCATGPLSSSGIAHWQPAIESTAVNPPASLGPSETTLLPARLSSSAIQGSYLGAAPALCLVTLTRENRSTCLGERPRIWI